MKLLFNEINRLSLINQWFLGSVEEKEAFYIITYVRQNASKDIYQRVRDGSKDTRRTVYDAVVVLTDTNGDAVMTKYRKEGESKMELYDVKQAASVFHVNTRTIIRWKKLGKIPHFKVGRRILFSPKHLEQFIDSQKEGGEKEK